MTAQAAKVPARRSRLHLFIPVVDQHELTYRSAASVAATVSEPADFYFYVLDNASEPRYEVSDIRKHAPGIDITVLRNTENLGMFYPFKQLDEWIRDFDSYDAQEDIIGAIHNDVFIYERGWDARVKAAFAADPMLMCIGFCGSSEVDACGGRGLDTKCNFDGRAGQKQENTGRRITDLEPAAVLDSLAMFFRQSALPLLGIDHNIAPYHFYDKILPLRLIDQGFRVGILGVSCDHLGGQTAVGLAHRFEPFAQKWCADRNVPYDKSRADSGGIALYIEAERRFFLEMAPKGLIPCKVMPDYSVRRMPGLAKYPEHMTSGGKNG